ncbi:DUF4097 family beta strand repeat-containing protein [Actinomadura oligospora]|uniref:DUF4097 family beta strand repeat-containing protein n=1 Tax=Actinomadura oligospora TaxID=111804 RepID=UPI00047B4A98|nr:DUF4097 family beta strand repeat-containing protein [Actinomadura oligospora]
MDVFETPEPISVEIEIYAGQITVNASDRADTVVDVRPTEPSEEASVDAAERTIVEFSGGRLLVKGPRPKGLAQLRSWRGFTDVTVDLPMGSRVQARGSANVISTGPLGETVVDSSNGDLRLEWTGPLDARTSNGEIFVDRVGGPSELTTSNGAIKVGFADGPLTLKSSNGHIGVGEAADDVQLRTGTGDVTVGRAHAGVAARTAYGRIRVDEVSRGTVNLESGYGKVGVGITEGSAAWLDVHSKHGVVRNALTPAEGPETTETTVVEVHVQTGYGDIDIRRA